MTIAELALLAAAAGLGHPSYTTRETAERYLAAQGAWGRAVASAVHAGSDDAETRARAARVIRSKHAGPPSLGSVVYVGSGASGVPHWWHPGKPGLEELHPSDPRYPKPAPPAPVAPDSLTEELKRLYQFPLPVWVW